MKAIIQTKTRNPKTQYMFRSLGELKEGDQVILHNENWSGAWPVTVKRVYPSGKVIFWEYNLSGNRRDGVVIDPRKDSSQWTASEENTTIERLERTAQ